MRVLIYTAIFEKNMRNSALNYLIPDWSTAFLQMVETCAGRVAAAAAASAAGRTDGQTSDRCCTPTLAAQATLLRFTLDLLHNLLYSKFTARRTANRAPVQQVRDVRTRGMSRLTSTSQYDTIRRYDIRDASLTRCKSDISHLNLPRGTKTLFKKW